MTSTTTIDDVHFLPDPPAAERRRLIISVDDHLVEPPGMFEDRMPARFRDRAPTVIDLPEGGQAWRFDGHVLPTIGKNAVAGRPVEEYSEEPVRFEHMRPGAWDVHARVRDMDLDGVYASLCFPSFVAGFGGVRIQTVTSDRELALATMRAWNDWHLEEWVGSHPRRLIPCQLTWLHDASVAADEIRRNAARGFKAVTFPEQPHVAGFPSLHSGYWDPFVAACAETGTVICLHTGSAGALPQVAPDAPRDAMSALFGAGFALTPTVDWLYSQLPVRYPDVRICLSEGGIGWVAGLMDRMDYARKYRAMRNTWSDAASSPAEVLARNFWFCTFDDPSAMRVRDRIGLTHIMYETDYPHADSTWPDSQGHLETLVTGIPEQEAELIAWRNAAALFRHEVALDAQRDPTVAY